MSTPVPQVNVPIAGMGGIDGTSGSHYADDCHSNNSDEADVEVVFDEQNSRRRKSSMVSEVRQKCIMADASCFVHQLFEEQRRASKGDLPLPILDSTRSKETIESKKLDRKDGGQFNDDYIHKILGPSQDGARDTNHIRGDLTPILAATNSRLLTKKQLSDMAWGVRELSKKLASMRLKPIVRNVFILTKTYDINLIDNTRAVVKFLLSPERDRLRTVYVENTLEKHPKFDAPGLIKELIEIGVEGPARRLKYWDNDICRRKPNTFDFVISLGGDGTVLYASWLFQQIVPPVLSFGLGSLGFLTKFDYNDYQDILTRSFRDGISVSLRLRFECTVMRSQPIKRPDGTIKDISERDIVEELVGEECEIDYTHKPDGTFMILNDLVVDRGPNGTMSSTELFGDDEHFTNIQADGVCVATPTGSTAYNLAAGGSLCHPENPVILVTAIAAHTLSFRPIILPDTIVLRVAVPYNARSTCWASFDGRERVELQFGDYVSVSASRYPFATIMNQKLGGKRSEDWVRSISGKLGWNTREKQKTFSQWD